MRKVIAFIVFTACTVIGLTACTRSIRISQIKLPEYSEIKSGEILEIKPEYEAEKGTEEEIYKAAGKLQLIWSSSDESVATVENGIVTGVSYGQAIITVATEDNTLSAQTTTKVKSLIESIEIEDILISEGDKDIDIEYSIYPEDIDNVEVIMQISDESIATVADGKLSANKVGETELILKIFDIEKTVRVTIKKKPAVNTKVNKPVTENKVNNTPAPITPSEEPKTPPAPAPAITPQPVISTPDSISTPVPTPVPTPAPQIPDNTLNNNQNVGDTHNPGYSAADKPIIEE